MKKNKTLFFAVPLMLILLFILVYNYGYLEVRADTIAVKDEQDIKIKLLQKYTELIADRPMIEEQISSLKAESRADDSKLIQGQTPSLSAATLQEIITGIIVEKGGTISSQRVSTTEDLGRFKVITISIDAILPDTAALSEILFSIETRTPYLIVKELDARVRNIRGPKDLIAKLDISALTGGQ
jgi:hypothetical protein